MIDTTGATTSSSLLSLPSLASATQLWCSEAAAAAAAAAALQFGRRTKAENILIAR